ncbi:MAG TPA: tetratricopeptide repeat protein [Thermoanaerobaculia bacterium]|nr:tetratricopeptide repeat protein [Thermoanaerobaculia bacterium]
MERIQVKGPHGIQRGRLLSALRTCLPGAWLSPEPHELISLYRLRYRMALEDGKYDAALIFLNKILEVDPMNPEAKLCLAEIYHRHLGDLGRAVEQYNKVIRLTASRPDDQVSQRARTSLTEILELLS